MTHASDLSTEYILLIDDEPDNLEVASYTLQLLYNARVLAVQSGQAALQALTAEITLILCDLMMPGMNGYELLPKLRERTGVPIIALTANAMEHDRQQTLLAGFDVQLVMAAPGRNIDLSGPIGRMSVMIAALMDEYYAVDISRRQKDSIAHRKRQGKVINLLFGTRRRADGYLEPSKSGDVLSVEHRGMAVSVS